MRHLFFAVALLSVAGLAAPSLAWDAVACVQRQVNALACGPVAEDGRIGRVTRAALERWNAGTLERWNAGTLERCEAVAGLLEARKLDGETAIIHCPKLGWRHRTARLEWPSRAAPFLIVSQDKTTDFHRTAARLATNETLEFLRTTISVELAAGFVLVIGPDGRAIRKLAAPRIPPGYTNEGLARDVKRMCAELDIRSVSYPRLILVCHPTGTAWTAGRVVNSICFLIGHELAPEAQWRLTGAVGSGGMYKILARGRSG